MFTFFDLLKLLGAAAGAVIGGSYGSSFGWPAAIVGTLVGLIVGMLLGNLPWTASRAWMHYELRRSSVAELKERLQREYFISHLVIGELLSRGEPLEQFRDYVAELLRSHNALKRHCGEGTARMWFPDLLASSSSSSSVAKADGQ
jgi:uncharacterized membrane-anchored protein YhcB (DUF1043 family)